jgi:hypothetical protein
MRQNTLGNIRQMLKSHLGMSLDPNTAEDRRLNQLLNDKQKFFGSEYAWPFLKSRFDVTGTAAGRFFTLPAVNLEHPVMVETEYSSQWWPLTYGINSEQFNLYDSSASESVDPIQRWQLYDQTQFEVWPIPTTTQTIRFTGQRVVTEMTDDLVLADLDDLLLVLFVTADRLMRLKESDAQMKLAEGQRRLAKLLAAGPSEETVNLAGPRPWTRRQVKLVAIHG